VLALALAAPTGAQMGVIQPPTQPVPGLRIDIGNLEIGSQADNYGMFQVNGQTGLITGENDETLDNATNGEWNIVGKIVIDNDNTNTNSASPLVNLYSHPHHDTTAVVGEVIGLRSSVRIDVDSPSGDATGLKVQAGCMGAGYTLRTVRGAYVEVVNKQASGSSETWTDTRGVEINMDLDQGASGYVTTFTNAAAIWAKWNLPTAGSYTTVTNGYGMLMDNEAVGGTGQMLDAALYVKDTNMSGGISGWDYGIDFSGVGSDGYGTADIKFVTRIEGGAFQNGIAYNGNEVLEVHGSSGATTSKPLVRFRVDPSTAQTTGQAWALQAQAYGNADGDTDNVYVLLGMHGEAGVKEACELITGGSMIAGQFKVEDLGNDLTATGDIFTLRLQSQFNSGSTISGEHAYVALKNEGSIGFSPEAFFYHTDASGGRSQSFIKTTQALSGTGTDWLSNKALTGDSSLDIENDAAILVEVNGTDYWIPLFNG
jgi:hypothetical protein